MLKIFDNKTIVIHRGDTGAIDVAIKQEDGSTYEMQEGDRLRFTVRDTASHNSEILLQIEADEPRIMFVPGDTDIPAGKYSCDIQLTKANDEVITIFPDLNRKGMEYNFKNFVIDAEVSDYE